MLLQSAEADFALLSDRGFHPPVPNRQRVRRNFADICRRPCRNRIRMSKP